MHMYSKKKQKVLIDHYLLNCAINLFSVLSFELRFECDHLVLVNTALVFV